MPGLDVNDLLVAGLSGAFVVLCGGSYAFFLACNLLHGRARERWLAYTSYLLLCAALLFLARSLHMGVGWRVIVAFLLLAYLVSPHLIWKLTQATHGNHLEGGSKHE